MIKLIALDFDGTTADTMPTLEKNAVKLIVENYNLNETEARINYRNTTGLPFKQQINMLFPNNEKNTFVIDEFEKEKLSDIFELPLFGDAKETIKELRNKGFLVAISSSTTQSIIEKYCKEKGLEVDQILGFRDGFEKGKDHFNFLMEKFNLNTQELVYIGDSLKDCERAQGSNILFIARIGMFSEEKFDEVSKSKLSIHNLCELVELIPRLNEK